MVDRVLAAAFAQNLTLSKSAFALAAALFAGAVSMVFPQAAVFLLAALAARALIGAQGPRLDVRALAGPLLAAILVGAFAGLAGAIGIVFVWRLIADTRWSVGEARRLSQAAGRPDASTPRALWHAWATPIFGLSVVAYTAPHMVAGLPLDLPHVPLWSVILIGAAAALAVFDWALKCAVDWRLGDLAAAPAAHLMSHHALFVLAFGLMIDVSAGIVAMLAWRLAHVGAARQPSFTAVP